ncbi:MAG: polyprenyl diphosphate synthase [Gammaproteobacteria bacterium]
MHPLRHVAVIMDGNGRWARLRNLPRGEGHRRGLRAARAAVRACIARGVPYLTLFAFSRENWDRPEAEVRALLALFGETARGLEKELADAGVRAAVIGQRGRFPPPLRDAMDSLEQKTANGKRLQVNVALNYSGRWDVAQAAERIAANGCDFSEENFAKHLSTGGQPAADLLIRTGGEQRISNFMLWQAAYSELYFTPVLWPDFGEADFNAAVDEYARRERRFGAREEAC